MSGNISTRPAVREGRKEERIDAMVYWKLLMVAYKAQRGWKRIPPAQRKQLLESAAKQARKHGPVVAKQVSAALQNARKGR
jgi:acyl-CoA reductase-like NAD-dependent aldehyde dehydrogenase